MEKLEVRISCTHVRIEQKRMFLPPTPDGREETIRILGQLMVKPDKVKTYSWTSATKNKEVKVYQPYFWCALHREPKTRREPADSMLEPGKKFKICVCLLLSHQDMLLFWLANVVVLVSILSFFLDYLRNHNHTLICEVLSKNFYSWTHKSWTTNKIYINSLLSLSAV